MKKKPLWVVTDGDAYEPANLAVTDNFQLACHYASIHDGEVEPIGDIADEWKLYSNKLTGAVEDMGYSKDKKWIRLAIYSDGKPISKLDFGIDSCLPVGLTLEDNRVGAFKFAYDNDIEVTK